jgi:hypothetical protein
MGIMHVQGVKIQIDSGLIDGFEIILPGMIPAKS